LKQPIRVGIGKLFNVQKANPTKQGLKLAIIAVHHSPH
jgi:hypothetical protein